jgi:hypothetical protein
VSRGEETGLAAYLVDEVVADANVTAGASVIIDAVFARSIDAEGPRSR